MAENTAKRLKTDGDATTIGTHNGHFHADEALAVHMLRQHIPTYANAKLVRTRDASRLETCDIVVDVGGEYDAERNLFDHHQRTFSTTFPGRPTKLSSAGLVYLHFGRQIIARRLSEAEDSPQVNLIWRKIYESFVEALDAHDNGISSYDPASLSAAGIEKRFANGGFNLGAMVGRLNPNWNDIIPTDPAEAQAAEDARFEVASSRIGEEFDRDLEFYTKAWLPARSIVADAFNSRGNFDSEGRIMVFNGQSLPWKDHLYTLEEELGETGKVLFVLYAESPRPGAKWRVQTVPVSKDSFQSRKSLPDAWKGFRDEKLSEISGIPGCVFVHAAGFIGGNHTFDGALAMAQKALEPTA